MNSDLIYISKNLYTSNQVRFRPIYLLSLNITGLYTKSFCHLINALTFTKSIIRSIASIKLIFA